MNKLIPGIFNYCDRWCERCNYTDRCRLYQSEAERNIQHILNDEDPNDPEIVARDIKESLEDAMAMLEAQMEIEGISKVDLEDVEDEDSKYFIDDIGDEQGGVTESGKTIRAPHPVSLLADDFFKNVMAYFDKKKPAFYQNAEDDEPVNNPIYEELKILMWYSPQIAVKTRMCAGSKAKIEDVNDEDEIEFETEMMNVNSRIAYTGIERCLTSLQKIYDVEINFQDDVLSMLSLIKKIKVDIAAGFPAVHTFKRPYFD
ncbi:MAG TPA: hypothetical protein VK870_09260 [Ignavibacteriaceae bacterium]|nr:hypothetical protein [Ignavibacteriaceae bacterium]